MRIYKERNGIWYLDLRSQGGGRISLETENKRIAEEILARKNIERIEGRLDVEITKKKQITLVDALNRFMDFAESKIRPSTKERYLTSMNNLLDYFDPNIPAKKLTPYEIEQYKITKINDEKKPATINRDLQLLRNCYNRLIKWDILQKNPVHKIEMLREDNIRYRTMSQQEIKTLLAECKKDYLHLAVNLSLHTGMRRGEILSLELPPEDIFAWMKKAEKQKRNWIYLQKNTIILNDTKTGKPREVPLSQEILPELSAYCDGRKPGKIFDGDFREAWENARKRAKLEDVDFHDLRRTFISILANMGYQREIIQSICGQVSEAVFKRYAHHSQIAKFDAVEKLGGALAEDRKILPLNIRKYQEK